MLDTIGTVAIVLGVLLTLVASIGLLSLPDVLSRMHAATKPQVVGLLLIVIGGALHLRTSPDVWMLVLVGAFQLVTAPVTAHVVGRLAHRGERRPPRPALRRRAHRPPGRGRHRARTEPREDDEAGGDDEDGSPHRNGEAVGRSRRRGRGRLRRGPP